MGRMNKGGKKGGQRMARTAKDAARERHILKMKAKGVWKEPKKGGEEAEDRRTGRFQSSSSSRPKAPSGMSVRSSNVSFAVEEVKFNKRDLETVLMDDETRGLILDLLRDLATDEGGLDSAAFEEIELASDNIQGDPSAAASGSSASLPASASAAVRKEPWACDQCTYVNSARRTLCEMCGRAAPSRSTADSALPQKRSITEEWAAHTKSMKSNILTLSDGVPGPAAGEESTALVEEDEVSVAAAAAAAAAEADVSDVNAELLDHLTAQLRFRRVDALAALRAASAVLAERAELASLEGDGEGHDPDVPEDSVVVLSTALDWLCLRLSEEALSAAFGARGRAAAQRLRSGGSSAVNDNSVLSSVQCWKDELALFAMCKHGFERAECDRAMEALKASGAVGRGAITASEMLHSSMLAGLAHLAATTAAVSFGRESEADGRDGCGTVDEVAGAAEDAALSVDTIMPALDAEVAEDLAERRADELMALRAILDDDLDESEDESENGLGSAAGAADASAAAPPRGKRVAVSSNGRCWSVRVSEVGADEMSLSAADYREHARTIFWLDILLPSCGMGSRYPEEAPLVCVRQASLEPHERRVVSSALAKEAAQHAGQEAVYALLCWLQTELKYLLKQRLAPRASAAVLAAEALELEAELLAAAPKRKQWANRLLTQMEIDVESVDAKSYGGVGSGDAEEQVVLEAAAAAAAAVHAPSAVSEEEKKTVLGAAEHAIEEARVKAAKEEAQSADDPGALHFVVQPSLFLADMVKTLEAQAQAMPWMFAGDKSADDASGAGPIDRLAAQRIHYEAQVRKESDRLLRIRTHKQGLASYKKMLAQRETLPCYKMREHIASVIRENQIVVLSGETGCGKTTQLPQIILDDLIDSNNGALCNMICTQPRRISAISVAERVADERAEKVGKTVGYSIRLESKTSRETRLLFCTTGVLLRRLQCDSELGGVSHIFVDEIHERDLNSDFLLIILKGLLPSRPNLKLILMSATLNATQFSEYFGDAPVIKVPGRTFPVEAFYLEDILELTGHAIVPNSDCAARKQRGPARRGDRRKKEGAADSTLSECEDDPNLGQPLPVASLVARYGDAGYSQRTLDSLAIVDENVINYELLHELLIALDASTEDGAILVFMPGMREITTLYEMLISDRSTFGDPDRCRVFPCHSTLTTEEQRRVFEIPPPGVRKIVISTNIAETSITITDAVCVVDSGRVKENRYDSGKRMAALVETFVSMASAKQRRGRAGRVRAGTAYHLFSSHTAEKLRAYTLPEMLRVPLEEMVLQIKVLDLGAVREFLGSAVNPPEMKSIEASLASLRSLQALDPTRGDRLTPLGYHLALLPVEPRLGKIIVLACIFGCLAPALTIAASLSIRSPFVSPMDKRDEAQLAKREFALALSDHLTLLKAYEGWEEAAARRGRAEYEFCRRNFLSFHTLRQIQKVRNQFVELLIGIGFVQRSRGSGGYGGGGRRRGRHGGGGGGGGGGGRGRGRGRRGENFDKLVASYSMNAENLELVKAVVCSGLYPNLIKVGRSKPGVEPPLSTPDGSVSIHPCSVAYRTTEFPTRLLMYLERVKTSAVFVRDCTPVSPYPVLLFGGSLTVHHSQGVIVVDDIYPFNASPKVGVLIKRLRAALDIMLLSKIERPDQDLSTSSGNIIDAICTLLAAQAPLQLIGDGGEEEEGDEEEEEEQGGGQGAAAFFALQPSQVQRDSRGLKATARDFKPRPLPLPLPPQPPPPPQQPSSTSGSLYPEVAIPAMDVVGSFVASQQRRRPPRHATVDVGAANRFVRGALGKKQVAADVHALGGGAGAAPPSSAAAAPAVKTPPPQRRRRRGGRDATVDVGAANRFMRGALGKKKQVAAADANVLGDGAEAASRSAEAAQVQVEKQPQQRRRRGGRKKPEKVKRGER